MAAPCGQQVYDEDDEVDDDASGQNLTLGTGSEGPLIPQQRLFEFVPVAVGCAPEAVIPPTRSSRDFVELDGFRRLVDRPAETGKAPAAADRPNRQKWTGGCASGSAQTTPRAFSAPSAAASKLRRRP